MDAKRETPTDQTLAALADPARRKAVELLQNGPVAAGAIAEACERSAAAMSRHLRVLRRCGLVEETFAEHDARVRLYRLKPEPFANLRQWLERVEAFWEDQLDSFRERAEQSARTPKP